MVINNKKYKVTLNALYLKIILKLKKILSKIQ